MRHFLILVAILIPSLAHAASGDKHYLYLSTPDGAQPGGSGKGILVFDIDDGHRLVRRIDIPFKEGLRGFCGNVKTHAFCPTCGSPVYLTFAAAPDLFTVHAASLDDPSRFEPQVVTYHMRALAWDHLDPELPMFGKMPPS